MRGPPQTGPELDLPWRPEFLKNIKILCKCLDPLLRHKVGCVLSSSPCHLELKGAFLKPPSLSQLAPRPSSTGRAVSRDRTLHHHMGSSRCGVYLLAAQQAGYSSCDAAVGACHEYAAA